ncbi:MAG: hypothetical protein KDB14_20770 [Planctomycetales bacterium]|nr:hypothetical protein [Planctomycetales bacterium]
MVVAALRLLFFLGLAVSLGGAIYSCGASRKVSVYVLGAFTLVLCYDASGLAGVEMGDAPFKIPLDISIESEGGRGEVVVDVYRGIDKLLVDGFSVNAGTKTRVYLFRKVGFRRRRSFLQLLWPGKPLKVNLDRLYIGIRGGAPEKLSRFGGPSWGESGEPITVRLSRFD